MANCDHSGFHSGLGKLARDFSSIRFVLVCDDCGAETREVQIQEYSPPGDAAGEDVRGRRAAA